MVTLRRLIVTTPFGAGWSFLPPSACYHAEQTISSTPIRVAQYTMKDLSFKAGPFIAEALELPLVVTPSLPFPIGLGSVLSLVGRSTELAGFSTIDHSTGPLNQWRAPICIIQSWDSDSEVVCCRHSLFSFMSALNRAYHTPD